MAVTRNSDAVAPVRTSGPLSIWLGRHRRTAVDAFVRLVRQPFSSAMITLVIAVTLALPASIGVIIKNVQTVSGGWDNALDFSVFLNREVTQSEAEGLARLLGQRADIESVSLITRDDALAQFRSESGFGDALDQLSENPLPHALVVRPSPANTSGSLLLLKEELTNLPETEFVQVDTEWVQRFHAILDIVRQALGIGSILLGCAIIVIVSNTIRLDIENRRDEIEVTKLIGASNAFVRRPFLWSGFWFGLLGSLVALGLVHYGLHLLSAPVGRLAGLYQSNIAITALNWEESLTLVGIGVALGLLASWSAATRHMRRIEPR